MVPRIAWNQIGNRLSRNGRMHIRFGAIPSRVADAREIMKSSLREHLSGKRASSSSNCDGVRRGRFPVVCLSNSKFSTAFQVV